MKFIGLSSLAVFTVLACTTPDTPCGPGQIHKNGFCVADASAGGSAGAESNLSQGGSSDSSQAGTGEPSNVAGDGGAAHTSNGGASGTAGDGSAGTPVEGGLLGDTCASDDDCSPQAHYCAINPGDPSGYCTPTGCDLEPTLCPSTGYYCEVEYMAFGYPSFCMVD